MKTRCCSMALIFSLCCFSASSFAAGWVDDWIDQKTETSPGFFEGQKRGYATAGSFSARWPVQKDYLWTVEPPRLKAGCGGIDAFMGGFSYLNFDYLIEKLQNILASAPAAAFDMALQAYCPQCSQVTKDMGAMSDMLNAIQLDDCKASKALVALTADAAGAQSEVFTNAMQEFMTESGLTEFHQGGKKILSAGKMVIADPGGAWDASMSYLAPPSEVTQAVGGMMAGCPAEIQEVLLSQGSLIAKVGTKLGLSALYTNLIRGFVGDIYLEGSQGGYLAHYLEPCSENNGKDPKTLLDGEIYIRPPSPQGQCVAVSDTNKKLRQYVTDQMVAIAAKMKAKTPLGTTEFEFIDKSPLPISLVLTAAIGTNQEQATIASLADVTARAYALQILADLYNQSDRLVSKILSLMQKQKNASGSFEGYACKLEAVTPNIQGLATTMKHDIDGMYQGLQISYTGAVQELTGIYQIVANLRATQAQIYKEASKRMGEAVARRAMKNM